MNQFSNYSVQIYIANVYSVTTETSVMCRKVKICFDSNWGLQSSNLWELESTDESWLLKKKRHASQSKKQSKENISHSAKHKSK